MPLPPIPISSLLLSTGMQILTRSLGGPILQPMKMATRLKSNIYSARNDLTLSAAQGISARIGKM
jgi:hypothetical protein